LRRRDKWLLFNARECIRKAKSTCLDESSPFFGITHAGVDALMLRLAEEVQLMSLASPANIGPDSAG
jgi:hypothetical protein